MKNNRIILMILCILAIPATMAFALHAHTHIGRNQDQTLGTADDNKLWFFAMPGTPGFPNWGDPLELVYQESGPLAGKYVCTDLYCWHSAHPAHGQWQLGGTDPIVTPDWRIVLERVSFSEGFSVLDYDTLMPVLTTNGDTYSIPMSSMEYENTLYNENGTMGAWSFHHHQRFVAEAGGLGKTFSATFRALDSGATGFGTSEAYTINFVTVPEPVSMVLIGAGALLLRRRWIARYPGA